MNPDGDDDTAVESKDEVMEQGVVDEAMEQGVGRRPSKSAHCCCHRLLRTCQNAGEMRRMRMRTQEGP